MMWLRFLASEISLRISCTTASGASTMAMPSVSNCGRPARPDIWWYSAGVTRRALLLMYLRSDGNTARLAGRLMPAEMVSVHTTNLMSRSRASCSTSCL